MTRDALLASKQAAMAAKEAFTSPYLGELSQCAVGLSLNRSKDDWVVKVYAQSLEAGSKLPAHFGPYAVDIEVTGAVSAC